MHALFTAVSSSSWRMLQAIGVGDRLEGKGCPIESIRVSEGLKQGGIVFDPPAGETLRPRVSGVKSLETG